MTFTKYNPFNEFVAFSCVWTDQFRCYCSCGCRI